MRNLHSSGEAEGSSGQRARLALPWECINLDCFKIKKVKN